MLSKWVDNEFSKSDHHQIAHPGESSPGSNETKNPCLTTNNQDILCPDV